MFLRNIFNRVLSVLQIVILHTKQDCQLSYDVVNMYRGKINDISNNYPSLIITHTTSNISLNSMHTLISIHEHRVSNVQQAANDMHTY